MVSTKHPATDILAFRKHRDREAERLTHYLLEHCEAAEVQLARKRSELANHLCGQVVEFGGTFWLCTDQLGTVVALAPHPGVTSKLPLHGEYQSCGPWMEWIHRIQQGEIQL